METENAEARRIACGEVWGGMKNTYVSACTGAVEVSLYSSSCDGRRGGDIYYISTCSGDLLTRIVVADVLGHGEAVGTISRWVYESLQLNSGRLNGARMLESWNRRIAKGQLSPMTTAAAFSIVPSLGKIFFSYAGHPPALIRRAGQPSWQPVELNDPKGHNYPLGVEAGASYDQQEIAAGPGDRLLLYTDGVIEAGSGDGALFGIDGLIGALNAAERLGLAETGDFVLDRIRRHAGGQFDHDDVTLLAVEIAPAESKHSGRP